MESEVVNIHTDTDPDTNKHTERQIHMHAHKHILLIVSSYTMPMILKQGLLIPCWNMEMYMLNMNVIRT